MADEKKVYVVMRASGKIMNMHNGLGGADGYSSGGPYLSILSRIADEHSSAGGDYDRPDKLFLNGKPVVEGGLTDLAWDYRQDQLGAREASERKVKNLHMPTWLPEDETKPGYNLPGLSRWEVHKVGR